ncbi:acyltransferase family protein [Sinimarinibacterium flocculans]|uniref:acyltransferase family protein n=1 Tax=Sinimarinibacterium flocculans TaxID=985250 RepID=UPI00248FF4D8|nr:acyltransferase [Sinimarinibacterium flocculans]
MPRADTSGQSGAASTLLPPSSSGEIASLNGIRALAVALVFLSHGGQGQLVPGGLGVTLFFVLSGFLITTLMQREYRKHGAIHLRNFYLRRVLRLMPPLLIVVALSGVLAAASLIDGGFSLRGLLSVLFYFGNYHVIATDFGGIPAGLGVIWSLAVEEHYYLLYPPLALLLLRWQRPRRAAAALVALCVAILLWRSWLYLHGVPEAYLTMATDTRADAILIGCAMAFLWNPAPRALPAPQPRRDLPIAVACALLLAATLLYRNETFRLTLRYTLQCLALAPLILLAIIHARSPAVRWLNARPLVYIGTVSYTIYLSHQVVLYGVIRHWPQLNWAATLVLTLALTLALAEPMRRWIEVPCAELRRRLHQRTQQKSPEPAAFNGATP